MINKPKVRSVSIEFGAEIRNKNQNWLKLTTEEYNFFDSLERLFYLDARVIYGRR